MKKIAFVAVVLWARVASAQVTYPVLTIAFPHIVAGGDPNGLHYVTVLQIVNNNSAATSAHVALFSDSGSPLAVLFDAQGPQSSMDLKLDGGQSRQIQISINAAAITTGWMQIVYTPCDALTTVLLDSLSGPALVSEIGVDPSSDVMSATDFAAETDGILNTGIALANPDTTSAYVLASLWDPNTGNVLASNALSVPARGHLARFLTELFPNVSNIKQIRAKVSLDSCAGSACNSAGGNGFFATAVRINGDQLTTIPVADRPDGGNQIRILPQVAFGGPPDDVNVRTILYFTTNVPTGIFGTADIFDDDGNPLRASADGAAPSSSITFTIAGNRVTRMVLSGDEVVRSGWLRLTLPGTVHLVASAVFQTFVGSSLASEASILESAPLTRGLIYVKSQSMSQDVGVAFVNPQPADTPIDLKLLNRNGDVIGTRQITLPPGGHVARFVTELFPQIASVNDFDGALSLHSSASFAATALRLTGAKIAALPIAPNGMYRPTISTVRVIKTQRSPAQVNFEIDVSDYDSDIATDSSSAVSSVGYLDFGDAGYDYGPVTLDGSPLTNRAAGTLSGTFQPPNVTGAVPSGYPAVFYIYIFDSLGNQSNFVAIPTKF